MDTAEGPGAWDDRLERAAKIAEAAGAECRAELVPLASEARLAESLRRTLADRRDAYFQAVFHDRAQAQRFAEHTGGTPAGQTVLVDASRFRARLARRAHEARGTGHWLPKARVSIEAWFSPLDWKTKIGPEQVQSALSATSAGPSRFALSAAYGCTVARVETDEPHETLAQLERAATHLGERFGCSVVPADPLTHAVGRIRRDLEVLR